MAQDQTAPTPPPGFTPVDSAAAAPPPPPGFSPVDGSSAAATQQPTISPAPKASDIPTFGYEGQPPAERLSMPLVKLLIPLHEVLEKATSMTPAGRAEHPIMAKIGDLADNVQELLTGGQSAGKPIGTRSGIIN